MNIGFSLLIKFFIILLHNLFTIKKYKIILKAKRY